MVVSIIIYCVLKDGVKNTDVPPWTNQSYNYSRINLFEWFLSTGDIFDWCSLMGVIQASKNQNTQLVQFFIRLFESLFLPSSAIK